MMTTCGFAGTATSACESLHIVAASQNDAGRSTCRSVGRTSGGLDIGLHDGVDGIDVGDHPIGPGSVCAFGAVRERVTVADVPEFFQGNAIALVTAGLMSMAFMGFTGLVNLG